MIRDRLAAVLLGHDDADVDPTGRQARALALMPSDPAPDAQLLLACTALADDAPVLVDAHADLLLGDQGEPCLPWDMPGSAAICTAEGQFALAKMARRWIAAARAAGAQPDPADTSTVRSLELTGAPDEHGVRATKVLSTVPVPAGFYATARVDGVVVYEPFGGLCAGLEMALRNGLTIKRYLYSDIDPAGVTMSSRGLQVRGVLKVVQASSTSHWPPPGM